MKSEVSKMYNHQRLYTIKISVNVMVMSFLLFQLGRWTYILTEDLHCYVFHFK